MLGRAGKLALADVRRLEQSSKAVVFLDNEQLGVFGVLKERITAPPRTIPASRQEAPILISSDGSCEEINGKLVGAVGAVMFGGESRDAVRAFGSFVPECLMEQWQNVGKRHLIGPYWQEQFG